MKPGQSRMKNRQKGALQTVGIDNIIVANLMFIERHMKRSCILSHPSHQTIKTLRKLSFVFADTLFHTESDQKKSFSSSIFALWTQCSGSAHRAYSTLIFQENTHI